MALRSLSDILDIRSNPGQLHPTTPTVSSWTTVLRLGRRTAVDRGRYLIGLGEASSRLYLLESGRLSVVLSWPDGSEKTIQVIRPGSVFGAAFLFRPDLAIAGIRADAPSVVYHLSRDEVFRRLREDPRLAVLLCENLSETLWLYARQIEDLRFRTVEERVAGLLSTLAARRAKVARSGSALRSESRRSVQLTHSEIADLVGAHRVSVTNSLRALEERGLVEVRPRRIVLRDPAGLLRLAARAGPESVAPGAGR